MATTNIAKLASTQSPSRSLDKGKIVEVESRFKRQAPEPSKGNRPEKGKFQNTQSTRDITCFKCQVRGHMTREYPHKRIMILTDNGEYESQDEPEKESVELEEMWSI